jgi:hypothetical protein
LQETSVPNNFLMAEAQVMAEVAQDARQEFWQSPAVLEPAMEATLPAATAELADACADCGGEFMIGARFCHTCGLRRPVMAGGADAVIAGLWARSVARVRSGSSLIAAAWRNLSLPDWIHYLHFHEIKRRVGLPTAALIAFMIGLGCVAGAIGVSVVYRASNLSEFQAIQMWRIEWLLAATASFVAGILLKKPSDIE